MEPMEPAIERDCGQGRAWLASLLESLADARHQERAWVMREGLGPAHDYADDVINDLYDRFLEGGADGLLGCEIRDESELALLQRLERLIDDALAEVDDSGLAAEMSEAGRIERARRLLALSCWPAVRLASAELLSVIISRDAQEATSPDRA